VVSYVILYYSLIKLFSANRHKKNIPYALLSITSNFKNKKLKVLIDKFYFHDLLTTNSIFLFLFPLNKKRNLLLGKRDL